MQIVLKDKISSTGLDLPLPTWFSNLRLATKDLRRPSIDDAVCNALAQYVRKINEARAIKASTEAQVEAAKKEAESATEAAQKQITIPDVEKRLFAAETQEKIWRAHTNKQTNMAINAEQRIVKLHETLKKAVEPLGKRLESLEAKLERAQKDGNEDTVSKIAEDITHAGDQVKQVEKKRANSLAQEFSILQTRAKNLQEEKQKLELQLADAKTAGFTTDALKLEALEVEFGILRVDHDILAGKKSSLEDKCVRLENQRAELEAKYAQLERDHVLLEVKHSELQDVYGKTKTTLKKAVDMARAKRNSRASITNGTDEQEGVSPIVEKGKKRAAEEDGETGSPEKRARMEVDVTAEVES
jgi:chromosome segregation ATPase